MNLNWYSTVNILALQNNYPYFAPINPIENSYAKIGQEFHDIRPGEYFKNDDDPNT